jgi:hypothetical protein
MKTPFVAQKLYLFQGVINQRPWHSIAMKNSGYSSMLGSWHGGYGERRDYKGSSIVGQYVGLIS